MLKQKFREIAQLSLAVKTEYENLVESELFYKSSIIQINYFAFPLQKDNIKLTLFQKLKVLLYLNSTNIQHEKLELKLVEPFIEGKLLLFFHLIYVK